MRRFLALMAVLGVFTVAPRLAAQPEVKPGPEHALLKESEGSWDATIKSMGGESKGTHVCKMDLGGLWLVEQFKGDIGGMTFEGRGVTSYDAGKKKFVNVWIDSMSTLPMISEGTYDKKTSTLTMTGSMPMPEGKTMKVTMVTVFKDANTKTFTLKGADPDGKELEMIQITYKRRVK